MIKLQTSLIWPGCAQGVYIVRAKRFIVAVLYWGDDKGTLNGWGPFAYVPIDPAGNGIFSFTGRRAIPYGVTHVWARCYAADFSSYEDASVEIPSKFLNVTKEQGPSWQFSILTDLHMASKPFRIRQALRAANSDMILLVGDSTNDGKPDQFKRFLTCIEDEIPEKTVLSVPGNHDIIHPRFIEKGADGSLAYAAFQKALLEKAEAKDKAVSYDAGSLAWSIQFGELELIGLQCVISERKFLFPESKQIDWLEEHLKSTPAKWHIILCHAPLLTHNPHRNSGTPYLDDDERIQKIIDSSGRVIFLSGHTHESPNVLTGNGEYDEINQNIYLDCGSVAPTDTSGELGLMSPDWKDGCKTELIVTNDTVEICMSSIESGIKFPRGYYRFNVKSSSIGIVSTIPCRAARQRS